MAAARLAGDPVFDRVGLVASSPEPKAVATAEPIAARLGLTVLVDHDLRESERPDLPILARPEHEALVARYLEGEELEGWEPQESVRARFAAALGRIRSADRDVAAVSHGRALALYLGLTPAQWAAMRLPDVVAVCQAEGGG